MNEKDYGKVTRAEWNNIVKAWKASFGGGSRWCRHEYGKLANGPEPKIMATVVYPNGVEKGVYKSAGDYVETCGLCGRVKGTDIV